jgi:hypothetical protein
VHTVLEAEPLAGADRLRLGHHAIRLLVLARFHDLAGKRLDALAKRLLPALLPRAQVAEGAHDRALELRQRIGAVLGRELPHQRDALLLERAAQQLVDVLLYRAVAAGVETR